MRNPKSLKILEDLNRVKSEFYNEKLEKGFQLNESIRQKFVSDKTQLKKTMHKTDSLPSISNTSMSMQAHLTSPKSMIIVKQEPSPTQKLISNARDFSTESRLVAERDFSSFQKDSSSMKNDRSPAKKLSKFKQSPSPLENLKGFETQGRFLNTTDSLTKNQRISLETLTPRLEAHVTSNKEEDDERVGMIERSHQSKMIMNFDKIYDKIRADFDYRAEESLMRMNRPKGYELLRMTPQQERMEIPPLKIFIPPKLQQIHNISITNENGTLTRSNKKFLTMSCTGREGNLGSGAFSESFSNRIKKHVKKKKDFLRDIINKFESKDSYLAPERNTSDSKEFKSLNSFNSYQLGKGTVAKELFITEEVGN